jgi:predicted secreted protein
MSITAVIVIFATIWFLALLVCLPIGIQTQGEANDLVPGTPASAPVDPMIRKKVIWATCAAVVITTPLVLFIILGGITIRDLDIWHVM